MTLTLDRLQHFTDRNSRVAVIAAIPLFAWSIFSASFVGIVCSIFAAIFFLILLDFVAPIVPRFEAKLDRKAAIAWLVWKQRFKPHIGRIEQISWLDEAEFYVWDEAVRPLTKNLDWDDSRRISESAFFRTVLAMNPEFEHDIINWARQREIQRHQ